MDQTWAECAFPDVLSLSPISPLVMEISELAETNAIEFAFFLTNLGHFLHDLYICDLHVSKDT